MPEQPPFPFIVGCPRSGTTLLRAMLDSHPQLAIPPESFFIPRLATEAASTFDSRVFTERILRDDRFRRWGLPPDEVIAAVNGASNGPDAIRRLYRTYARAHGKVRYGDKTPQYAARIDVLSSMFPEARFVHLIRDGRNVALSMLDVPFGPKNVAGAAVTWRKYVTSGREPGRRLGPSRYQEVRYERLVADPGRVLRSICRFLELPFVEEMLDYPERADNVLAGTIHPRAHRSVRSAPTVGLRDWRRSMSRRQLGAFEALAAGTLEQCGYQRALDPVAPWHRLEARRQITLTGLRKLVRRSRLYTVAALRSVHRPKP